MKSGVVLEIEGKNAIVLSSDGIFRTVKKKKKWQKGDTISIDEQRGKMRAFYAVAASIILFLAAGWYGTSLYFNETALVSMDVNPAFELKLNCFDKVLSIEARNAEGKQILDKISYKNKQYEEVLDDVIQEIELAGFTAKENYVTFSVQANSVKTEKSILKELEGNVAGKITQHHPDMSIEYYAVDEKTVEDAHCYGVTAGKYMVLQDLLAADPQINVEEYTHHSIGDIKQQAEHCRSQAAVPDTAAENTETPVPEQPVPEPAAPEVPEPAAPADIPESNAGSNNSNNYNDNYSSGNSRSSHGHHGNGHE